MKTKHIIFSLLAVFAFASALFFNACKKDAVSEAIEQYTQISQEEMEASKAMTDHILEFKERMEYYRDNPNIKSGGIKYAANEAVIELESQLNFNYCYTDIEFIERIQSYSEVIMPLDALFEIWESDLSIHYFDDVIVALQDHMTLSGFSNKKLMIVDLELNGFNTNGDAMIGVNSLIANQGTLTTAISEDGWWYGYKEGSCAVPPEPDPWAGIWDAALDIQSDLRFANIPAPPPGKIRRTNLIHTEGPLEANLIDYRTPNDILDNYMDYRVFYATSSLINYPITDETKCLSYDIEMPFYLQEYDAFIGEFETVYSLEFIDCIVEGKTDDIESFIQHDYTIYLGDVWFINQSWVIGDIMNPN